MRSAASSVALDHQRRAGHPMPHQSHQSCYLRRTLRGQTPPLGLHAAAGGSPAAAVPLRSGRSVPRRLRRRETAAPAACSTVHVDHIDSMPDAPRGLEGAVPASCSVVRVDSLSSMPAAPPAPAPAQLPISRSSAPPSLLPGSRLVGKTPACKTWRHDLHLRQMGWDYPTGAGLLGLPGGPSAFWEPGFRVKETPSVHCLALDRAGR